MDLCTLAQVKTYLSLSNSTSDAILQALIDAYSQKAYTYCGRIFDQQTFNENRNGLGGQRMLLRQWPVTAVSSVLIDAMSIPAAGNTPTAPGWHTVDAQSGDGRILLLQGYRFSPGYGNVQISYTAGYAVSGTPPVATVPNDLAEAVIELVALRYKSRDWIGYNSKSLAGETVSFVTSDMPSSIKAVLDSYKSTMVPQ